MREPAGQYRCQRLQAAVVATKECSHVAGWSHLLMASLTPYDRQMRDRAAQSSKMTGEIPHRTQLPCWHGQNKNRGAHGIPPLWQGWLGFESCFATRWKLESGKLKGTERGGRACSVLARHEEFTRPFRHARGGDRRRECGASVAPTVVRAVARPTPPTTHPRGGGKRDALTPPPQLLRPAPSPRKAGLG